MSFADAYIEKNVELRASEGLKVTVIRRQIGDCCKWCRNLAGIYMADQLPDDIYKRHANCYGIIAGHNGHIYKYKAKNTYNSANVKIYIDRLSRQYYNNEEDKEIVKTLEELKKAGVTIEKI